MITNIIVISSIVAAGLFLFIWLLRRDLREQIEHPKYHFQDRVRDYDEQYHNMNSRTETKGDKQGG